MTSPKHLPPSLQHLTLPPFPSTPLLSTCSTRSIRVVYRLSYNPGGQHQAYVAPRNPSVYTNRSVPSISEQIYESWVALQQVRLQQVALQQVALQQVGTSASLYPTHKSLLTPFPQYYGKKSISSTLDATLLTSPVINNITIQQKMSFFPYCHHPHPIFSDTSYR